MGKQIFEISLKGCAMEDNNKPLVSLCITCYNQAEYIRESVQSAFEQTYSPLEIVISDDCSTDGTDKIIEEMIAIYNGPHKVLFNRNETNLYVCKNYEKAFRLAHGELLITGAGDDISLPNRVERIVKAWLDSGREATYITHAFIAIDKNGHELYTGGPWEVRTQLGATTAYSSNIVKLFGDIPFTPDIYEDGIFSLRAFALGSVVSLREPLSKWRIGTGLSTKDAYRNKRKHISLHQIRSCEIFTAELKKSNVKFNDVCLSFAKNVIDWRRRHYSAEYAAVAGRFPWTRLNGLLHMTHDSGWDLSRWDRWVVYGSYVPPFGLGRLIPLFAKIIRRLRLMRGIRWCKLKVHGMFRDGR